MKNSGIILKQLRKKYGYSLEEVAKKIGTTNVTISRYETNQRKIGGENLVKLAKLFNVTPEYILNGNEEEKDIVISQDSLTKHNMAFFKAKDISDEDKKKMIESIQEFYYKQKYEKDDE
ncbi:helix-turn-helix domain-containing protein [Leptotrichia trevisanii]